MLCVIGAANRAPRGRTTLWSLDTHRKVCEISRETIMKAAGTGSGPRCAHRGDSGDSGSVNGPVSRTFRRALERTLYGKEPSGHIGRLPFSDSGDRLPPPGKRLSGGYLKPSTPTPCLLGFAKETRPAVSAESARLFERRKRETIPRPRIGKGPRISGDDAARRCVLQRQSVNRSAPPEVAREITRPVVGRGRDSSGLRFALRWRTTDGNALRLAVSPLCGLYA